MNLRTSPRNDLNTYQSKIFSRTQTFDEMAPTTVVTVLGAGYSGLTTAAELTVRGFKVNVVAYDLGKLTHSQEFTILNSEFLHIF